MRRRLASTGLLVALSLEACGCNPLSDLRPLSGSAAPSRNRYDLPTDESALSFYDPPDPGSVFAPGSQPENAPGLGVGRLPAINETKPLPWAIPESVYFIYKSHTSGTLPPQQPIATAFVLSVPNSGHDRHLRFLVTARHVVDPQWAHCSDLNPVSIDLRLNRRTGGVAYETLPLRAGATRRFYTPADPTADLAVIPLDQNLIPNLEDYKFIDVPFRLLLTSSEMRLVTTDQQVMTARPSARPSGELSNYPVFDGGVLTNMPSETIGVRCGVLQSPEPQARLLHVWFINAGVPQGVSGAPVYASITRIPGAASTQILLGVQSVTWPDSGVAGITPAPALGDLIRSVLHESRIKINSGREPSP